MATALLDTYNSLAPVKTVRRARRAYVGLLGFAFERAADRVDNLRAKRDDLLVDLAARGEALEGQAKTVFAGAKDKAGDVAEDGLDAAKKAFPVKILSRKDVRIASLEAEIAAAELMLKAGPTAKKKAAPKAKAVVKTTTEKVETPAATVEVKVEATDKYAAYYEKVAAYDADADAAYIRAIVTHLGIALQSRDGQLVACSDAAERDTVRDSWLVKKLGVTGETEALDAKVLTVCEAMKADRMKDRVVFYYLLAKQEGKLAAL